MGKWADVDDIKRPAADVAAEVLQSRVRSVRRLLPLAAHHYREDIEHVHQLRVSCRRASAALQPFRPQLKGNAKPLRSSLRRIRHAAGPARDIDVMLQRLQDETVENEGHEYVITRLKRRRKAVQPELIAVSSKSERRLLKKNLQQCVQSLRKAAKKKKAARFDRFAHKALKATSHDMFQLAELQQPSIEQLHQLRIAGKRLRYSIEIFHSAFPAALREEVYPLVEEIQSRLGQLNDHATSQAMFQKWLAKLPPDENAAYLADQILKQYKATVAKRDEFLQWWQSRPVVALQVQLDEVIDS